MIVTIDGPAGSGKSTAARRLAAGLGIAYLDTGATYRAVTLKALLENVELSDDAALAAVARRADIRLCPRPQGLQVMLDGCDVSAEIRSQRVTEQSLYAARSPMVRSVLVELQRKIGRELGSFVTEGRDQGSVVFPEADVKFYLDAESGVRARRRHDEIVAAGGRARYEEVLDALVRRDRRDSSRSVAPLTRPQGAVEIDTSAMSIDEMVAAMLRHVEARH